MRPFAFLTSALLPIAVLADTEIRNFRLPLPGPDLPSGILPKEHSKLYPSQRLERTISSAQPEQFFLLTFNESYTDWTVRLSWPGSYPTKWHLSLSPSASRAILYVSAKQLSPRFPHPLLNQMTQYIPARLLDMISQPPETSLATSLLDQTQDADGLEWSTTFHIILEPLLFGVLPRTAIPAVLLIIVFVVGAALCVPSIIRLLERARARAVAAEAAPGSGAKQKTAPAPAGRAKAE